MQDLKGKWIVWLENFNHKGYYMVFDTQQEAQRTFNTIPEKYKLTFIKDNSSYGKVEYIYKNNSINPIFLSMYQWDVN